MTEQNREDDDGITIGQVFKVMFHNKIRLLIVGVVTLIVALLFIVLIYNKNNKTYTAKFTYSDINIANGHYSDGSIFDINDLVDYMDDVKASNQEKYGSIDTTKIIDDNNLTLSFETSSEERNNAVVYTLVVSAKYFSNYDVAKSFITDLIEYPLVKNNLLVAKTVFDENLILFDNSNVYENQINYLSLQKSYILNGYQEIINTYGDRIVNDTKISSRVNDINLYFDDNKLSLLTDEMELNGYVKNLAAYESSLKTQKNSLQLEYETNVAKIDGLNSDIQKLIDASKNSQIQTLDLTAYNNAISQLTQRNVDIQYEIKVIDRYLNSSATYTSEIKADFESRLLEFRTKLSEFTKEYEQCYLDVIENYNISYDETAKVVAQGGMSTTTAAIVSVLVGLVVACVVNLCVDHKMLSKNYIEESKAEEIK